MSAIIDKATEAIAVETATAPATSSGTGPGSLRDMQRDTALVARIATTATRGTTAGPRVSAAAGETVEATKATKATVGASAEPGSIADWRTVSTRDYKMRGTAIATILLAIDGIDGRTAATGLGSARAIGIVTRIAPAS